MGRRRGCTEEWVQSRCGGERGGNAVSRGEVRFISYVSSGGRKISRRDRSSIRIKNNPARAIGNKWLERACASECVGKWAARKAGAEIQKSRRGGDGKRRCRSRVAIDFSGGSDG